MVVAPLSAGDEVFGALGTFSHTADAFTAPQIALVRALSDHAALAMANARLIEELDRSREAIERQATIERSLRELGTRISGARDPEAVVQHTIDEALRLLDGDGARIDIVDPEVRLLRGMYSAGEEQILETEWPRDPDDRLEVGASGRAVVDRPDVHQPRLPRATRTSSTATAPTRTSGPRASTASSRRRCSATRARSARSRCGRRKADAFGPDDATLLETIAGQSAVALGRARLIEELGRSRETLARRAEEERDAARDRARLGAMGDDPADILNRIVHEAARLLGGERARLDLIEPLSGSCCGRTRRSSRSTTGSSPRRSSATARTRRRPASPASRSARAGPSRPATTCATTRFRHYPEGDRGVTEVGLHSIIAAPVVGEDGLLGVLQAGHRASDAFGDDASGSSPRSRRRPRSRSPTPGSSTGSPRRRRRSGGPPTPSARCARSPAG